MRTPDEVRQDANALDDGDVADDFKLAPAGMVISTVKFIVSAMEDDLDHDDKRTLFAACAGKTEQEMIELAYKATADEERNQRVA